MAKDTTHQDVIGEEQRRAIRSLFRDLPSEYSRKYQSLSSLRLAFHEELAAYLQPFFNEYLKRQPYSTMTERTQLAASINEQTRLIGLAPRCPRTSQPALILVDRQDAAHPDVTRFRFQVHDEKKGRYKSFTSMDLPEFELMPAPPRIESLSRSFRHSSRRDQSHDR